MTAISERSAVSSEKRGETSMFRRIVFCLPLILLLLTVTEAQQAGKISRVGFLSPVDRGRRDFRFEEFREGLHRLGYMEGQTIALERRSAEGKVDLLPVLAAELVQLKVDVIVAVGIPATMAAKNTTKTIPIVMIASVDPVGSGIVESLAHPGGNITGLSGLGEDLSGKRLELLKEVVPKLARMALIWNSADKGMTRITNEIQASASLLGVKIEPFGVRDPSDFGGVFAKITQSRPDALLTVADRLINPHTSLILEFAIKRKIPTMWDSVEAVEAGALMTYVPDRSEVVRRAAAMVDKILKGTKPADLPVEQPMKFEFVVNLKTAKQIGLTIPPNVLARADRVIR
jgi:putative ABC transport system substrate-binding protein